MTPAANLPPVSLIPVAICRRCDTGGNFAAGMVDTGGKFATGINNTSETGGKICRRHRWYRWQTCRRRRWYRWQICRRRPWYRRQFCCRCRWHRWQICHRCRWYRWSTLSCEYLRDFSKKFETALMVYLGGWGKLIQEKNQKKKISRHCPFKTGRQKYPLLSNVKVSGSYTLLCVKKHCLYCNLTLLW